MGSSDTIRQMEKELMALRKQVAKAVDTTEVDALRSRVKVAEDLAAQVPDLNKQIRALKSRNTSLTKKISALEASLKVVDTAVDKALDDE